MKQIKYVFLIALIALAGCASVPPVSHEAFSPLDPSKARIHLTKVSFSLKNPTVGNKVLRALFLPRGGRWLDDVLVMVAKEEEGELSFVSRLFSSNRHEYIDVEPGANTLHFLASPTMFDYLWRASSTWKGELEANKEYTIVIGHAGMSHKIGHVLLRGIPAMLPEDISQKCADFRLLPDAPKSVNKHATELIKSLDEERRLDLLKYSACRAKAKTLPASPLSPKALEFWEDSRDHILEVLSDEELNYKS